MLTQSPNIDWQARLATAIHLAKKTLYIVMVLAISLGFGIAALVFLWRDTGLFAFISFAIGLSFAGVMLHPRSYNYRFAYPGVLALSLFVVYPVFYTFYVSLTNYTDKNLISYERAERQLLSFTYLAPGSRSYEIIAEVSDPDLDLASIALKDKASGQLFQTTSPISLLFDPESIQRIALAPVAEQDFQISNDRKFAISYRNQLDQIIFVLPDDQELSKSGLKTFAALEQQYQPLGQQRFHNLKTGDIVEADRGHGAFVTIESDNPGRIGTSVVPRFRGYVGLFNYLEIFANEKLRSSFWHILAWTVFTAVSSVSISFLLALAVATLLSWPAIRFAGLYQTLLVLSFAFPVFVTIGIFNILFAQQGLINQVLTAILNIQIGWIDVPLAARAKFLIVQTWLAFPFMFVMCSGMIQSIPDDAFEAAVMEGAGPLQKFRRITLPMVFIPMTPILIIAFANAFNDLNLVQLLTGPGEFYGWPLIPGSVPAAGETDLLVSFAYRQAFFRNQQDFALGASLSTVIFLIVGLLSIVYLKLVKNHVFEH